LFIYLFNVIFNVNFVKIGFVWQRYVGWGIGWIDIFMRQIVGTGGASLVVDQYLERLK